MPDPCLIEEPLQFGEGGRLIGILTRPGAPARAAAPLPAFVLLSAGALHRVGPARLHVHVARALADRGFSSLRVDLAGIGDSARRPGLATGESALADFKAIAAVLDSRLGRVPLVLAGLCSGADHAIRLTPGEPRVVGLVLIDPVCFPDFGFRVRGALAKYTNPDLYWWWIKRRWRELRAGRPRRTAGAADDYLAIRNLPTREQLRAAFAALRERDGRALSVFTQYALPYYNHAGQLKRVLAIDGCARFCTEIFWRRAEHTFPLEFHRRRLIEAIDAWAAASFLPPRPARAPALELQAT